MNEQDLQLTRLYEVLRTSPNNSDAYNNLGSVYYKQRNIADAIPNFEKAIRLNPKGWEAHYNLANCYIKQNMVQQAITHYLVCLGINPQHSNSKINLAMALVSLKDYATALPWLIEIANADPKHAELQGHLAEAYLDLGQSTNAIMQYTKALDLEPTRAEWHHNLAVLYLREKDNAAAKKHFSSALQLQPDNQTAKHMLDALNGKANNSAPTEYVQSLFDQYAPYYNQHVTTTLEYCVPHLLRQAMSRVITAHTKQKHILDLGCGTGLCGIYFRDLARFLLGVDISHSMLQQAKVLGAYDALCRCDILSYIPGTDTLYFDLIIAADVLVYIGDLCVFFTRLASALQNSGEIAFSIEEHFGMEDYVLLPTGRYAHSQRYIEDLCTKLGWEILINEAITPRKQQDMPIAGRIYVLRAVNGSLKY